MIKHKEQFNTEYFFPFSPTDTSVKHGHSTPTKGKKLVTKNEMPKKSHGSDRRDNQKDGHKRKSGYDISIELITKKASKMVCPPGENAL